MEYDELATMIVATAGLGNAASAIVQALKWRFLRTAGFARIPAVLGNALMRAIESTYGATTNELLQAQYCRGRSTGQLGKTLRQGIRLGLAQGNAEQLATTLGVQISAEELSSTASALASGSTLTDAQRSVLGRYELAADERISASLAIAEEAYTQWVRLWAMLVAVALALVASFMLLGPSSESAWFVRGLIVGVAAVPLAPISHDLQKAFTESRAAVRAKGQ